MAQKRSQKDPLGSGEHPAYTVWVPIPQGKTPGGVPPPEEVGPKTPNFLWDLSGVEKTPINPIGKFGLKRVLKSPNFLWDLSGVEKTTINPIGKFGPKRGSPDQRP